MNDEPTSSLSALCAQLAAQTLPRWQELPDLDLYMDQVLALIDRYLSGYPGFDNKGLTSSMVNNYVKLGIVPPPVRKKYTRAHLSHLIIICILKPSLPIASIQELVSHELAKATEQELYNRFCGFFEDTVSAVAASASAQAGGSHPGEADVYATIYHAALRAQAEQALALELMNGLLAKQLPPEVTK